MKIMRNLAKFENVNVIEILQKIMEHNTEFYQSDFAYDVDAIKKAAKSGGERKGIFWMSRKCGTWAFVEKNVLIRNTPDYRTWRNYQTEIDGVKAFWIWADHEKEGIVTGSILELDYDHIKKELSPAEVNAESVYLVFRKQENSRSFPILEFEENRQTIIQRYGPVQSITYQVRDENAIEDYLDVFFQKLYQEAKAMDIGSYTALMEKERFEQYGYVDGNLHFITPDAALKGVDRHLDVYGVQKNTGAVLLQSSDEVRRCIQNHGIFGMTAEEKNLLSYVEEKGIDGLFTKEEQEIIYHMVLQAGISGQHPQRQIGSITHKLECAMGRQDSGEISGEEMENER